MSTILSISGLCRLIRWTPTKLCGNIITHKSPYLALGKGMVSPGFRHLFAMSSLGIDGYTDFRKIMNSRFNEDKRERFLKKMYETVDSQTNNMIFSEDLKSAIHLVEANEEDITLVMKMMKKFNSQHSGLRFSDYIFGPVIMRMFHYLNQPEMVLQALKSEELGGFFDQFVSHQIAMDLLYEHGRYEDVIEVFHLLQEIRLFGVKYHRLSLIIALAALYKMNTQESYNKMIEIVKETQTYDFDIGVRGLLFAAGLALNQNNPNICLEIVSKVTNPKNKIARNLKILALIELGKVDETLPILRSIIQIDLPHYRMEDATPQIFRETINKVEVAVEETGEKVLVLEFQRIAKGLESNHFITEKTLDENLCQPIMHVKQKKKDGADRAMLAASFNRNVKQRRNTNRSHYKSRPGLMDAE